MKDCCQYVGLLDNKNKAQYEEFKYHNNQGRKELERVKIKVFYQKSSKVEKMQVVNKEFQI